MPRSSTHQSQRLMALLPVVVILCASVGNARGDEPRGPEGEAAFRGKIVFFGALRKGDAEAGVSRVLAINPDGTGLETLFTLSEKGRSIDTGRVSPDAKSIAFTIFDQKTKKGEVWLLEGSKGDRRKVLDDGVVVAWSPDGKNLACIGGRLGAWKSFIFDLKTNEIRPLPIPQVDCVSDWSPDGKFLSVMLGRPDKLFKHPKLGDYPLRQIELLSESGDNRRTVTTDSAFDILWSRFSPDGTRIAHYQREHRDGQVIESSMIRDRDGSNAATALSYNRLDEGFQATPEGRSYWGMEGPASWSPDGKTVAWLVSNAKSPDDRRGKRRWALAFTSSKGVIERSIDLTALRLEYSGEIDWGK